MSFVIPCYVLVSRMLNKGFVVKHTIVFVVLPLHYLLRVNVG